MLDSALEQYLGQPAQSHNATCKFEDVSDVWRNE